MRKALVVLVAWGLLVGGGVLAEAHEGPESPTRSIADRLEDRRYVAIGDRAYVVGTEDGYFPAMGFHTRGEMGGIWTAPLKLLDGLWFGIDGEWVGPATQFTSGYGHVVMDLPSREGLTVRRTDFVPDGQRGALIGLELTAGDADEQLSLAVDVHSELMSIYPWGETTPNQLAFNLQDTAAVSGDRLEFREQGTPPVENAEAHDWAAVVGSALTPTRAVVGEDYRGPQEPPLICPATGPAPERCDDTAFGRGAGGRLTYDLTVPAGETQSVWFAVAGSEEGADAAHTTADALLADPAGLLASKIAERLELAGQTRLDLPGDPDLAEAIDWSKQNLADSVQVAEDLELREVNAGVRYPPPAGELEQIRFLGAGFPDYPWLFATDGEYTAFASVAVGQFEPIQDHLRALRDASLIINGDSGKVVHEVIHEGSVYFGSLNDPGNTDETAKFPSAVRLLWAWTGDDAFLEEMYDFTVSNMRYIVEELDEDGDGWPEGLGNVERPGMGPEKLDNTVYTIRGLWDLVDMARYQGDTETVRWASRIARDLTERFDPEWWMPEIPQHADSLGENNERIQQRHWIGATPMEVELRRNGLALPGLTSAENGNAALDLREQPCYGDDYGMFHTGAPGCDPAQSAVPAERTTFSLNTSIISVAEGNYGRMGPDQQQRWTFANARLQLEPDEQPGNMPEIAPSPDYGRSIDRPLNERAMVLQAWGAYGTIWPVVHQQLGISPDLGRGRLDVVPQVPDGQPGLSGENIRLGAGSVDVAVTAGDGTLTTTVTPDVGLRRLRIGGVLPAGSNVASVTLDGRPVPFLVRDTNRGREITVTARPDRAHTVVITSAA